MINNAMYSPEAEIIEFTPSPFHTKTLEEIREHLGYTDPDRSPFFRGETLRDLIYNLHIKPKDTPDVITPEHEMIVQTPFTALAKNAELSESGRLIPDRVNALSNAVAEEIARCSIIQNARTASQASDNSFAIIEGEIQNKSVRIMVIDTGAPISEYGRYSDINETPLNTIAMGLGETAYAHYDFLDHLENGIFRYDGEGFTKAAEMILEIEKQYPNIRGLVHPKTKIPSDQKELFKRLFLFADYPGGPPHYAKENPEYRRFAHPDWIGRFPESEHHKRRQYEANIPEMQ